MGSGREKSSSNSIAIGIFLVFLQTKIAHHFIIIALYMIKLIDNQMNI